MTEMPDQDTLSMLAATLLADATFVFAETSTDFTPRGSSLVVAAITLTCGEPWQLVVVAEPALAQCLAANLLGIDEDAPEAAASAASALGEWVNMLAGAVALECKGGEGACRIGLPAVTPTTPSEGEQLLARASRRANLVTESGHHLAAALQAQEAA